MHSDAVSALQHPPRNVARRADRAGGAAMLVMDFG
jgi:hypothetical protein